MTPDLKIESILLFKRSQGYSLLIHSLVSLGLIDEARALKRRYSKHDKPILGELRLIDGTANRPPT